MASLRRWQKLNAKSMAMAEPWASLADDAGLDLGSGVSRSVLGIKKPCFLFGSRAVESGVGYSRARRSRLTQIIRWSRERLAPILIAVKGTMASTATGQAPLIRVSVGPCGFIKPGDHSERGVFVNGRRAFQRR